MSTKAPVKKPEYKGERLDRTSQERLLCRRCSRLATHRARKNISDGRRVLPFDMHLCELHLNEAIKGDEVHMIRVLPEFRLYLHRLRKWDAAQHSDEQGTMW